MEVGGYSNFSPHLKPEVREQVVRIYIIGVFINFMVQERT